MSIAEKLTVVAQNVPKVYEAGQQAAYDRFWDAYQGSGERYNYYQLFAQSGWTDETFNPKYPILCEQRESWDTTNANSVFYNFRATRISVPITVNGISMNQTFHNAIYLETVSLLTLNNVPSFSSTFSYCYELKNITIGGSIDVNIGFPNSPQLTTASVQSIIDHLKDLTGATAQTLTFHADVGAAMTDEQKAAITAKNWTLVY